VTKPELRVDGAKELRKALKQFESGVSDMKAAHLEGAQVVERRAVQLVPRLSGTLAASLRSAGQAGAGVVRAGRASVPYAGVQHFGWPARNIRPKPYLYDALDDRRAEVIDVYEKRVGELISKYDLA
jgi:hypothetical protein